MDNHDDLPDLLEDKISRLQEINADLLAACKTLCRIVTTENINRALAAIKKAEGGE